MRAVVAAVVGIASVLVISGCGGSGPTVSLSSPLAEQVELARASNDLFSIFPAAPGTKRCGIPDSASTKTLHGTCESSIAGAATQEPALIVTFTETWNSPPCLPSACTGREVKQHSWKVIEAEPVVTKGANLRVAATHSSGAAAPQNSK